MKTRWMLAFFLIGCTGDVSPTDTPPPDPQVLEGWAPLGVDEANDQLSALQIVDTRSLAAFNAGHLPGALHLDSGTLRGTNNGVSSQILPRPDAEALFTSAGLDASLPTLVYGDANDTSNGVAYFALAYHGANDGLLFLDGGMEAWEEAGYPTDRLDTTGTGSSWGGSATQAELRVEKAWMLDHLNDNDVAIFDVRSASEYSAGHIPGAVNVEWTENITVNGLFRRPSAILDLHDNPTASTVVVYCQSGARASVSWAALTFTDLPDVRLYDGSWGEWGSDDATPKVMGSAP